MKTHCQHEAQSRAYQEAVYFVDDFRDLVINTSEQIRLLQQKHNIALDSRTQNRLASIVHELLDDHIFCDALANAHKVIEEYDDGYRDSVRRDYTLMTGGSL